MAHSQITQAQLRVVASLLRRLKIGKPIDTRKQILPSAIRGGKSLKEWADKLDPVTSGKATIVPASAAKDKGYRKLYERARLTNGKELLIVPHSADEKVILKKGKIIITHPSGIERVQIPVEYHNLEQFLSDARGKSYSLEGQQYFAFRFYGGSSNVFRRMDDLLEVLTNYASIQEAIDQGDKKLQREMYRNLEVVRIASAPEWRKQRQLNLKLRGVKVAKKRRRKKR